MKTSFSSNLGVQSSLAQTMAKAQKQLVDANKEVSTGQHADMGVSLGSSTTRSLDLTRELLRIESLQASNALAKTRIDSSEGALKNMADNATKASGLLTGLGNNQSTVNQVVLSLKAALDGFTAAGNSSAAGEYLFSGTNTDVKPLTSYTEQNSPLKEAVDRELNKYLTDNGIASKSDMTAAQTKTFLADLEKKFNGQTPVTDPPQTGHGGEDFWTAFGSGASSTNMSTRITPSETITSSVNANDAAFRNFTFGAIVAIEFLPTATDATRSAIVDVAQAAVGRASTDVSDLRSQLGLSSERIAKATDSLQAQKKILEVSVNDLQSVDPYEAATRVTQLQSLLEAAYTLTSKLQKMSLINYL
ncbi:flagellar hook-associated family protein [Rhizobium sp. SSA_523]|uniref:flagellar hook-associated family protein n=1 Tax=Rhizobium sp. SSA_523 TaxID=2952477 RepID=UPI00208FFDEB|nr:flagellar hook-associated family protein [Rhizobium sp. SSA_523]MCO5733036.1 flagellar hook-associated family protein [Rhizobium sp. SSA_523]WKC23916.1 flagellar hook-associated family protein [Rhizobium sp. SSA_523]